MPIILIFIGKKFAQTEYFVTYSLSLFFLGIFWIFFFFFLEKNSSNIHSGFGSPFNA
jgi:hypothetical protein